MIQPIRAIAYIGSITSSERADELATLQDVATARGWTVVTTIAEPRLTGTISSRSDRPGLHALLPAAARREFEVLVLRSLADLANTLPELIRVVNELRAHGIELVACDDGIDTTTEAGKSAFTAFAALAEFQRAQIRERSRVSLQRARRAGVRLGRPSNVNPSVNAAIVALRERGFSIRRIATELRVGNRSVYAALEAAKVARGPTYPGTRTTDLERPSSLWSG